VTETSATSRVDSGRGWSWGSLSFRRIGAIYVLILIWVLFSLLAPETFPQFATVQQIANANAIAAIVALGLALPVAAGLFDVSFPYVMTLSGVVSAKLVLETSWPVGPAYLVGLLAAGAVGLLNALVLVKLRIESLIGTLATGALVAAAVSWLTGDYDVVGQVLLGDFAGIGQTYWLGFNSTVFIAVVLAVVVWLVFEHTALGRRVFAVGFNFEAVRLTGINGSRLQAALLVVCSLIAGAAGILLASRVGSAGVHAGTPYLLPAFAAVFLGATQFKDGRVNSWGVMVAVFLLGTGATGLGLAGAPIWAGSLFTGIVLIVSLTAAVVQQSRRARGGSRRSLATSIGRLLGRRHETGDPTDLN